MPSPSDRHLSPDEIQDILDGLTRATGASEIETHLANCEACQSFLQACRLRGEQLNHLRERPIPPAGPECPPESAWLELVCGVLEGSGSEQLLNHAEACDCCGQRLREAVEQSSQETSPEEDRLLEKLQWSKERTSRFATELEAAAVRGRHVRRWRQYLPWAVAAVVILGAGITFWLLRTFRALSPEQMIAQAYTEERTLALRIPGARYAPLKQRRGSDQSRVSRPYPLIAAESAVSRALERHPDSATLLQARGRIDLLDWDCTDAVAVLNEALRKNPNASSLWTDLASAYYECAEIQSRDSDLSHAVELLSQVLIQNPNDLIARFNRAVTYQRMGRTQEAIRDWTIYLQLDADSDWATEARATLKRLQAP